MMDNVADLSARREAKADEIEALRTHLENILQCEDILADAIELMWDFADRAEIVKALRQAADALESHED